MKKTFTRALSLILVLVMMIGVMPMAFAKEAKTGAAVTLDSASLNLEVGGKHQIRVTSMISSFEVDITDANMTFAFSDYDPQIIQVSDTGEITALKAGETGLQVEVTASDSEWTYDHIGGASIEIVVSGDPTPPPSGGEGDGEGDGEEEPEITYTVALDPAELTVAVGQESDELKVVVTKKTEGAEDSTLDNSQYQVVDWQWTKDDTKEVIKVADRKVTGLAEGKSTVEVTVKINDVEYTATCEVTVAAGAVIECSNLEVKATEYAQLKPVLKIDGEKVHDVDFKFTPTNPKVLTDSSYDFVVDSDKEIASFKNAKGGAVEFTITVEQYQATATSEVVSGADIEPLTVYVRFYRTVDLHVTMKEGKTKIGLDEPKVFSKILINNFPAYATMADFSLQQLFESELPEEKDIRPNKVYFSGLSVSAPGELVNYGASNDQCSWLFLDGMTFEQNGTRTGSTNFYYKIVDKEGLIMMDGYCTIVITGGEGDIHYETTYNKAVTVKEADFLSYWSDLKLGSQYTLKYVTFDTTGIKGKLYTNSSSAKKLVTSSMRFYITPGTGEYDLGAVYYVPDSKTTSEYVDSIPFTAVDAYGMKAQSGTLSFGLNTKTTSITSRGVVMGTTYTKNISDAYKANTGADLGYVIFELPEAKYGKLYTKLPGEIKVVHGQAMNMNYVAEGAEMKKDDQLWYSASSTQFELAEVAFIPAAGFKGEVELKYSAYDKYGTNEHKGTLRFTVTTKTASGVFADVTAKSYSWAADSADFLFYEGVAQGSKAAGSAAIKYNPSANITRQDFMLMLYRAFLAKNYNTFTVTSNFPDVVKGTSAYTQEIYQAVGVAKYLGIAQGSNNKFNPKSNITRQEAMVLIYRTLDVINKNLEYTTTTNIAAFKDYNKISSWATSAISYLVNHGVIQGSNDKINPAANITRAEMACILHRVLTY